jgi:endoglucanase
MQRYTVNGLDLVPIDTLARMLDDEGFNCVHLPFSLEMYYKNPVVLDDVVAANPQLMGMTALEVFDKTVEAITSAGVAVILNNHISDAIWCCSIHDSNGLWHNQNYTALQWQNAVVGISVRYASNKLVIGNDLRNEVRPDAVNNMIPTWGNANVNTDWKLAATTCGNKILAEVPDSLIFIEGTDAGGFLEMVRTEPVLLSRPNKLVYSFHIYAWDSNVPTSSYPLFK